MVTGLNVGNSLLSRAFKENVDVTPMKLQKLIYFVYRDYLKETNQSLFDESFQTWKYGPVLPSVYATFNKKYGSNAIRTYATECDGKILCVDEGKSPTFKKIIDHVWDSCKDYNGIYLSAITHRSESAWRNAAERNSNELFDEDIKEDVVNYER